MTHIAMQDFYNSVDEQGWRCALQNPANMADHALVYLLDLRDGENPQFMRDVFVVPDEAFAKGEYVMDVPEDETMEPAEYFGQVSMALCDRLTAIYEQEEEELETLKNALVGLNIALANFIANANQQEPQPRKDGIYNHYIVVFNESGLGAHGIQTEMPVIGPDQLSETVHQLLGSTEH